MNYLKETGLYSKILQHSCMLDCNSTKVWHDVTLSVSMRHKIQTKKQANKMLR